jgi:hypothetical protein
MQMIDSFYWEKYRWEFMRRNAEFRRGYDEYLKVNGSDKFRSHNPNAMEVLRVLYQWGYYPSQTQTPRFPNPYKSFEEEFTPEEVPIYFKHFYTYVAAISEEDVIQINIDMKQFKSVAEIKKRMIRDFELALKTRKKSGKVPKTQNKIDYNIILIVGDLKAEGLTYQQIAKRIFPRDFNSNNEKANPESAIRKVGQYYQKYRKLVEGGYKDIIYVRK